MGSATDENASEPLDVRECKKPGTVMTAQGKVIAIPEGWKLLPPGDATVTRRVKAAGEHWVMRRRKGNKWFSLGIWADAERIDRMVTEVAEEKKDPAYQRKLDAARNKRAEQQQEYELEFRNALRAFLRFHRDFRQLEDVMVDRVTLHAIPVGSGTVARTSRISTEEKVKAATVAWMRHQTTNYDHLSIARVKGRRREVRRKLAGGSMSLLEKYRRGTVADLEHCPLAKALSSSSS